MNIKLGNRIVGEINREKNAFITYRDYDTHYFKLMGGFGFNEQLLKQLYAKKIEWIWVFIQRENLTLLWKISTENALLHGKKWRNDKDLLDNQLIVPNDCFEKC